MTKRMFIACMGFIFMTLATEDASAEIQLEQLRQAIAEGKVQSIEVTQCSYELLTPVPISARSIDKYQCKITKRILGEGTFTRSLSAALSHTKINARIKEPDLRWLIKFKNENKILIAIGLEKKWPFPFSIGGSVGDMVVDFDRSLILWLEKNFPD